ncbi:hypothetical protein CR513_50841, partial [Mucuna pruriens]
MKLSVVKRKRLSKKMSAFAEIEMPHGLPPLRGIEHQIDLVPSCPIPNRLAYRTNPEETKEIQKQVNELLQKGFVREVLVHVLFPLSWFQRKMEHGACALIVGPSIKSLLDDMLDEWFGSCVFTKIDLKSEYN